MTNPNLDYYSQQAEITSPVLCCIFCDLNSSITAYTTLRTLTSYFHSLQEENNKDMDIPAPPSIAAPDFPNLPSSE